MTKAYFVARRQLIFPSSHMFTRRKRRRVIILANGWRQNGGTRKAYVIIPLAYSSHMEDFYDVVVHQQLLMKIEKAFPECSEEKCVTIYHDVLSCVRNTRYVSEKCFYYVWILV